MRNDSGERQQYALHVIYSFFLGAIVFAFVSVGLNTIYPEPVYRETPEIRELEREIRFVLDTEDAEGQLPAEARTRIEEIQEEINWLYDEQNVGLFAWSRNTSILLVLLATFVMGVSLVQSERLKVLSNGLLLGGLFTMVYGVGWIVLSYQQSATRLAVIGLALVVTLIFGYLKFVRSR